MKRLWNSIDKRNWKAIAKYKFALFLFGVLFALAGFVVWLIIRQWALSSADWMICFIGCPAIISWFVVSYYSCRYEFHNGRVRVSHRDGSFDSL